MSLQAATKNIPPARSSAKPSLAARLRLATRSEKLLWKAAWSALGATAPAVKIDELHRRRVAGPAGDIVEYVRVVDEPAIIEPAHGYIVTCRGVLIEESLQTNNRYKAPWRNALPDPKLGWRLRHGKLDKSVRLQRVILLRHWWEWNYYHFFLDVLGKLNLLDSMGFDPNTPIVLGQYARELPWVTQLMGRGELRTRHWIIPDGTSVVADQVIYCRTQQNYKVRMEPVLDALHVPTGMDQFEDRLFLNRGGNSQRRLANLDEIWALLQRFNFKMIDSAQMSIAEQIEAFSKARYLVALHGAGTTNILFRRGAPLNLVELHSHLFPKPDKVTNFAQISRAYGYHYERLAGEPENARDLPIHGNFFIAPAALEEQLHRWVG